MKTVSIEIEGFSTDIQVKDSWNELSAEECFAAAYILFDDITTYERAVKLLLLLGGPKNFELISSLDEEAIHSLIQLTNFFIDTPGPSNNPLKYYKQRHLGFNSFYGPADNLSNVVFSEWILADTYFSRFASNQDENELNKLVAVLYRPFDKNRSKSAGDDREKFNENEVSNRLSQVEKWPKEQRLAVFLFFSGCKALLAQRFPNVFTKRDGQTPDRFGWMSLYDELLGGKFGLDETLSQTNIYMVFLSLERAAEKSNKNER